MIKNKELTYKDVPMGYPLCFNHECAKTACCMYYQARLTLPEGRHHGPYYRVHQGENMLTPEEQEDFSRFVWLFQLKSVFLQHEICIKSA